MIKTLQTLPVLRCGPNQPECSWGSEDDEIIQLPCKIVSMW